MNPGWRSNYLRYKSYFLNVIGRYRERADIRVYLEILLSLFTVSIFSIFALRPTLLTIAELIKEIEARKETLAKMEAKIENLAQAQSLLDRERPRVALLKTAVQEKYEPVILARQIEGLSLKHQSPILGLSAGKGVISGNGTSTSNQTENGEAPVASENLEFSFETSASIDQYTLLSNFLIDLEKLLMPVEIIGIRMNTQEKTEGKSIFLSIDGTLPYSMKEQ